MQKGGHLVDKRARAACARAVHAHLGSVCKKQNFRVLAAQLNHNIRAGHIAVGRNAGGIYLLHKGDAAAFGKAHARRAGQRKACRSPFHECLIRLGQHLGGLFHNVGIVTLISMVQQVLLFIQHHAFDGGAANVETDVIQKVLSFKN